MLAPLTMNFQVVALHQKESLVWICFSAFRRCRPQDSTLSATSDPIVASTLADPQYITEVVVTEDVVLTVFLGAAWNGGSILTGSVCTGASVWFFTGEVLVISDLVVGTLSGFSVPLVLRQVFSPFSTASQMVTAKAPPLPPVFLCISPQDQTVVVEVELIPANDCVHNFDCIWRLVSTVGKCFTIYALDVCGRASAGEERAHCSM